MFALDYIIKEWFLHIFRWWFVLEQMGPSVNFSCKLFLFIGTRNRNMGTSENQVTPWGSGVFWRLSEWRLWVCWFKPTDDEDGFVDDDDEVEDDYDGSGSGFLDEPTEIEVDMIFFLMTNSVTTIGILQKCLLGNKTMNLNEGFCLLQVNHFKVKCSLKKFV